MATHALHPGNALFLGNLNVTIACDNNSHIQNRCCVVVGFVCRKDKNIEVGGGPQIKGVI